jgi:hypothetical protein
MNCTNCKDIICAEAYCFLRGTEKMQLCNNCGGDWYNGIWETEGWQRLTAKQIARIERIRAERAKAKREKEEKCICESDEKPNPLCPDHQCCWACSTQSVPITLNEKRGLWLCGGCNDKGDSCPRIQAERMRRYDEKIKKMDEDFDKKFKNTDLGFLLKDLKLPSVVKMECACGCKGKSCVSCGAHVQQRDQYIMVERKHIHCLWCYKNAKKNKGK